MTTNCCPSALKSILMRQRELGGSIRVLVPHGRLSLIPFKKKEANAIRRFVREHEE